MGVDHCDLSCVPLSCPCKEGKRRGEHMRATNPLISLFLQPPRWRGTLRGTAARWQQEPSTPARAGNTHHGALVDCQLLFNPRASGEHSASVFRLPPGRPGVKSSRKRFVLLRAGTRAWR